MTSRRARGCAAGLCALVLLACAVPVYAQTPSGSTGPSPYQDHYIAGGNLAPDVSSGDAPTSDSGGLARSIRIDGVVSALGQDGPGSSPAMHEDGVIADGQWDTVNYGDWSMDVAARNAETGEIVDEHGTTSFSLHQRGMPFDGGWQADNALGDINAPLIDLARGQPRFLLTQGPMAGLDTQWRGPSGLELLAGAGEPGLFEGIKVPAFDTLGGSTATLGAQWAMDSHWSLGSQLVDTRDASLYILPLSGGPGTTSTERISSTTGFLTAAWQDGGSHVQLNLLDGDLNGHANSLGAWIDAMHAAGAITQSVGAFRIDPDLAWGNQLITNDVQGGYYRLDYQSRRWLADFDLDEVSSVSGGGAPVTFMTGAARYQLTHDTGLGGVVNIRHSDGDDAWSAEGYLDKVDAYGTGRVQVDYATDPQAKDTTVTVQQTWSVPAADHLASTVALDQVRSQPLAERPQDSTLLRLALYGGADLTARLQLAGTVQWAGALEGHAAPSRSADVSLSYQLSRCWSVLADYYENRIGSWTQLVVNSPLAAPTPTLVPALGERGIFLTVRFQTTRGAHFAPLGGGVGSGSGRLNGVVYLDANENGRYDAGETAVPNVTVILDGRFSVRTDNNGRFDFPAVAGGHHVLTVQADNLPLPWMLPNSGRKELEVATRGSTEVDIGALRMK